MMRKPSTFTGKHIALVFVAGFGIVIAVNLLMASLAVGSFHGTVVDNSYVASQNYNEWLAKAETSRRLGWQVQATQRADGRVVLAASGVPAAAQVAAAAERPLGARETTQLAFAPAGEGRWLSDKPLADGRWQLRIAIEAPQGAWAGQSTLP
ncbi:MAG: FixH family protein [Erythrobacter sp.]